MYNFNVPEILVCPVLLNVASLVSGLAHIEWQPLFLLPTTTHKKTRDHQCEVTQSIAIVLYQYKCFLQILEQSSDFFYHYCFVILSNAKLVLKQTRGDFKKI